MTPSGARMKLPLDRGHLETGISEGAMALDHKDHTRGRDRLEVRHLKTATFLHLDYPGARQALDGWCTFDTTPGRGWAGALPGGGTGATYWSRSITSTATAFGVTSCRGGRCSCHGWGPRSW
ncbi:hypothetical protein GCM10010446_66760 [Streptomyces enissocaesilis]|uniref:Uncharacterized protein n=1 Tax=Streptomyces enissocaesilis TaxID=332589 RepID=A0ABP6K8N4_9ACTN